MIRYRLILMYKSFNFEPTQCRVLLIEIIKLSYGGSRI